MQWRSVNTKWKGNKKKCAQCLKYGKYDWKMKINIFLEERGNKYKWYRVVAQLEGIGGL